MAYYRCTRRYESDCEGTSRYEGVKEAMGRQAEAACLPRKHHLKMRLESKAAIRVPPSKPHTDEKVF